MPDPTQETRKHAHCGYPAKKVKFLPNAPDNFRPERYVGDRGLAPWQTTPTLKPVQ